MPLRRNLHAMVIALSCAAAETNTKALADAVHWLPFDSASVEAQSRNRPVLLLFSAEWCPACLRLERGPFREPEFARFVNQLFIATRVDVDDAPALAKRFAADRLPVAVVLAPGGTELGRVAGYKPASAYQGDLERLLERLPREPLPAQTAALAAAESPRPFGRVASVQAEVALGGACPTTLIEQKMLVPGRPDFVVEYDGKTYWCMGVEAARRFRANPARYVPAYGGACPVTFATTRRRVAGDEACGALYQGRLFLFAGPDQRRIFRANPSRYASSDIAFQGNCPVCSVDLARQVEGSSEHQDYYRQRLYRFHDAEHRGVFHDTPGRFLEPSAPLDSAHAAPETKTAR
jgi:YHS domain-containing protein